MTSDADVLSFVASFTREHGYSPTVREVGEGVGLSSNSTVHWHLERLRKAGAVTWTAGRNRTLRATEKGTDRTHVPHCLVAGSRRIEGSPGAASTARGMADPHTQEPT